MNAKPQTPMPVVATMSAGEAAAIVRAITRALPHTEAAGNSLDVQRLEALRDCLQGALDGCRETIRAVES